MSERSLTSGVKIIESANELSTMKDDILSMKEPVFAVRPRVVFGLWEKHFVGKSTRWRLE